MTNDAQVTNSDYFSNAFTNMYEIADALHEKLNGIEYGSLVGVGLSGSVILPALSLLLNKPFAILRKPGVKSHSESLFVGTITNRWLFVDDFISTGKTYENAQKVVLDVASELKWDKVRRYPDFNPECVGSFEYCARSYERYLFTPWGPESGCSCVECRKVLARLRERNKL